MTNAEYITNKGWKFRDLFAQFSLKEEKWNIYHESYDEKLDSIHTPDFKDYFHMCDVVLAWLDMEHKEPILDDAEKKYLKAVIRPWRDKVQYIMRRQELNNPENSHLFIETKGYDISVHLPIFETGTMYKGMKEDKPYSLEDLGL